MHLFYQPLHKEVTVRKGPLSALTLVFLSSAIMGCADAPVPTEADVPEHNLAVVNTGFFDFNITIFDQCNGEDVDFVTKRKHIFNTTFDAAGGVHVGFHRAWWGTGVGQTTGTVYQLNWPWQEQLYARGPFPQVFSRRINNNLPTRGSAPNRLFSLIQHLTVNANGEVTVDFSDLKLTCVG
jgi:hypothetical protein